MAAKDPRYFERLFCETFLQHTGDPFRWSSESEQYRKCMISLTFVQCSWIWLRLDEEGHLTDSKAAPVHLFWALCFLKTYPPQYLLCSLFGTSHTSLNKWIWFMVEAIASLHVEVIRMNDRFIGWNGKSQCLLTVDGVHCRVPEPWPFDPSMWSHKTNGPALMYEVAVSIFSGLICWINGGFPASYHDKEVFVNEGLAEALEGDWELVEADAGYRSKHSSVEEVNALSRRVVTKPMYHTRKEGHLKAMKRACHETVNSRIKSFAVMDTRFRSSLDKHPTCFFAVCVLVQLGLREDKPLFKSEYDIVYPYLPQVPPDFKSPADEDDSSERSESDAEDDFNSMFGRMRVHQEVDSSESEAEATDED